MATTSVYVIPQAIDHLKTMLSPMLPHTAQQLHEYPGYGGRLLTLFGRQQVSDVKEQARSHRALTCDHSAALG